MSSRQQTPPRKTLLLSQRSGDAAGVPLVEDPMGSIEDTEPYAWSLLPFAGVVDQRGLDSPPFLAVDLWRRVLDVALPQAWEHVQPSQVIDIGTTGYWCCSGRTDAKVRSSRWSQTRSWSESESRRDFLFPRGRDFKSTRPRSRGAARHLRRAARERDYQAGAKSGLDTHGISCNTK